MFNIDLDTLISRNNALQLTGYTHKKKKNRENMMIKSRDMITNLSDDAKIPFLDSKLKREVYCILYFDEGIDMNDLLTKLKNNTKDEVLDVILFFKKNNILIISNEKPILTSTGKAIINLIVGMHQFYG